jgi:RNA polymerase sigma-70 factor (ECF subfamily)
MAEPDRLAGVEIQALLGQLPERYRQVMTLYYLQEKSYQEVAAMLGIPMGTVKTFLHRAKKELLLLNQRREDTYAKRSGKGNAYGLS